MRPVWLAAASLAVAFEPALAFACSGPGAEATILRHERTGWFLWLTTLFVSIALVLSRRVRAHRSWRNAIVAFVVVHPGWWMGARGGDCGIMLVEGSFVVTAVSLVICAIAFFRAGRTVRRPSPNDVET